MNAERVRATMNVAFATKPAHEVIRELNARWPEWQTYMVFMRLDQSKVILRDVPQGTLTMIRDRTRERITNEFGQKLAQAEGAITWEVEPFDMPQDASEEST